MFISILFPFYKVLECRDQFVSWVPDIDLEWGRDNTYFVE